MRSGTLRLAGGGAERRKIVLAEQRLRGAVHRLGIERVVHMPDPVAQQRRARAAVQDAIAVGPPDRREARVPRLGRDRRASHGDRMRLHVKVQRVAHFVGRPVAGQVDQRHLPFRVDARVGATGDGARDGRAVRQLRRRTLQHVLHRKARAGLVLPADIGGAVVLQQQRERVHSKARALPWTRQRPGAFGNQWILKAPP